MMELSESCVTALGYQVSSALEDYGAVIPRSLQIFFTRTSLISE